MKARHIDDKRRMSDIAMVKIQNTDYRLWHN